MRRAWRLAVLCLVLSPSMWAADEPSTGIAALYREAAYDAYLESRDARSSELIEIALEFDPSVSDSHYVRSLIAARDRERTIEAIAAAEEAIERSDWRRFTPFHGRVMLARLYNLVGSYERAADVLARAVELPELSPGLLSDYYYERSVALDRLGRVPERDEALELARDRFPDEARFFRLLLRAEPFPSTDYRLEIERLLNAVDSPTSRPDLNELLYEYAVSAPTPAEKSWARRRLEERGWDDPAIALLRAEDDSQAALEAFSEHEGLSDYDVFRDLLRVIGGSGRATLRAAASEFDGVSLSDGNRDGVWDERIHVQAGLITRWELDRNQDGRVELEVAFNERHPRSVVRRDGGSMLVVRYGQYPFVTEAEITTEGGRELFVLRPRSLRLEAVQSLSPAGPTFGSEISLNDELRPVSRRQLMATAVRIDVLDDGEMVLERTYIQGGPLRRTYRDGDADGRWDHLLLNDGGVPESGVRDLDADGYYEVAEGYRGGRLVALAVDADDDGVPEVFEREEGYSVREWDLNDDGVIDVREFLDWTESVIREFPLAEQER